MKAVEMLSVTIAQHGTNISFEQMWASEGDRQKLDHWYRTAIGDLEQVMMKWMLQSSAQFDLQADGTDYSITLKLDNRWNRKLTGLVGNKIQEYIVHSIIAGWLSDFGEVQAPDYLTIAAGDITSLESIILYREFAFAETTRQSGADAQKPSDEEVATPAGERGADTDKPIEESGAFSPSGRGSDTSKPTDETVATTPSSRQSDSSKPTVDDIAPAEGNRSSDEAKPVDEAVVSPAGERGSDTSKPTDETVAPSPEQRTSDETKPTGDVVAPSEQSRTTDDVKPIDEAIVSPAGERSSDTAKPTADEIAPTEGSRTADTDKESDAGIIAETTSRNSDRQKPTDEATPSTGERTSDTEKAEDGSTVHEDERTSDSRKADDNTLVLDERNEIQDSQKPTDEATTAIERTEDSAKGAEGIGILEGGERHEDECRRPRRHEDIDYSGSGFGLDCHGHWWDEY